MEIYWAALAGHLLVTLYLAWNVSTLYKLILAQLALNASLVQFAEATSKEMGDLHDDIVDLQEYVDEVTQKTPATS
jgi:cell division protein FtsB